jgi:hypothetical protein
MKAAVNELLRVVDGKGRPSAAASTAWNPGGQRPMAKARKPALGAPGNGGSAANGMPTSALRQNQPDLAIAGHRSRIPLESDSKEF